MKKEMEDERGGRREGREGWSDKGRKGGSDKEEGVPGWRVEEESVDVMSRREEGGGEGIPQQGRTFENTC